MKFKEYNIDGIKVILSEMDTTSISVEIWVKVGAVYETKENNGISHFLEHMFFKWSKKYPSAQKVAEILDEIWGNYNAYTSRYYTVFYFKSIPEYFEQAFDVFADLLVNPLFKPEDIEKERGVVLQELSMYEDEPWSILYDKFHLFYFGDNSYGWPIIGTKENINKFTRKDLIKYKNAWYTKDNLVISIWWKIENEDKILNLIKEKFRYLPEKKQIYLPEYPKKPTKNIDYFEKWLEQVRVIINIPIPIPENSVDKTALSILTNILWWWMSSVLFKEIRENLWLVYSISASAKRDIKNINLMIYAGIDKNKFDLALHKINEILDDFKKWNIKEENLIRSKKVYLSTVKLGLETSSDVASYNLSAKLWDEEIKSLSEIEQDIKSVKLDDIKKFTKNYFNKENRFTYYLK